MKNYKYRYIRDYDGSKEMLTNLKAAEVVKRMYRLHVLIGLTEGYEQGLGKSICEKAVKSYHKLKGFTGIIKLTYIEKEFLDYILQIEDGYLTSEEIETIKYYTKFKKEIN